MSRPLKVYGGRIMRETKQVRVIVAATTKAEAAKAAGITAGRFRDYWSETKNDQEIEIATRNPGELLDSPLY